MASLAVDERGWRIKTRLALYLVMAPSGAFFLRRSFKRRE
jgi:hypothetical protein